jgi:thiol-disulfide isomerase/thioredoxin
MQSASETVRLVAGILLHTLLLVGCTGDPRSGLNPGDIAPNIQGVTVDGEPIALRSTPAKLTLINFWATWCPPCIEELPALQAVHEALKEKGFQVVAVALDDSLPLIKEYQQRYHLTFPIIIDARSESKRRYEIKGLPESFLLDANQRVLLVKDPSDGSFVTRFVGPRPWSSKSTVRIFSELLQ